MSQTLSVRLLIADVNEDQQVYTDEQILEFIELEEGNVHRAAAQALETYAAHIAQISGPVRGLLDIRLGGEQSANTLLQVAQRFRRARGRMVSVTMTNFPDVPEFGDMTT